MGTLPPFSDRGAVPATGAQQAQIQQEKFFSSVSLGNVTCSFMPGRSKCDSSQGKRREIQAFVEPSVAELFCTYFCLESTSLTTQIVCLLECLMLQRDQASITCKF